MKSLYDLVQESLRSSDSCPVTIPVFSTFEGARERELTVTFTLDVLSDLQKRPIFTKKTGSVLNYGYIGGSRGGKNGIVDVRDTDKRFLNFLESYLSSNSGRALLSSEGISREHLRPVKVVAHLPQGERAIGFLDTATKKVYIVGVEAYS